MKRTLLVALVLAASSLTPACVGNVGGERSESGLVDVAPAGMRRMTPEQYTNSMRDLFGDPALGLQEGPARGAPLKCVLYAFIG
jgi:hypothetical protein